MLRFATLAFSIASLALAACSSGGKCDPALDCNPPVPGCDCTNVDAGLVPDAGEDTGEADAGTEEGCTLGEDGQLDLTGKWQGDIGTTSGGKGRLTLDLQQTGSALTGLDETVSQLCGSISISATVTACDLSGSSVWTEDAASTSQLVAKGSATEIVGTFTPTGEGSVACAQLTGEFRLERVP